MRKGGVPVTKNMYTVAGDGPCNEELALRIQAGDKNGAERLMSVLQSFPVNFRLSQIFQNYNNKDTVTD